MQNSKCKRYVRFAFCILTFELQLFFGSRFQNHPIARVLLNDREQSGVEETDREEHEERQRAVDTVGERVEDGRGEVQAKRELDQRLNELALAVLLADPLVGARLDPVLRRSRELGFLVEQRLEY